MGIRVCGWRWPPLSGKKSVWDELSFLISFGGTTIQDTKSIGDEDGTCRGKTANVSIGSR
jgi:hypothetical protein